MNVSFSRGGDSSSTCQNEYATPTRINATCTATEPAYIKRAPARARAVPAAGAGAKGLERHR